MNKERKIVETNSIVVFDRKVNASELNEFFKDFHRDIIINGDLSVDTTLAIKCDNLYVEGALIVEIFSSHAKIDLQGNLYVRDEMDCYDIHVDGSVYCSHRISAVSIDVAQDLDVVSNVDAENYNINVGGNFTCESVKVRKICVLQKKWSFNIKYHFFI